MIAKKLPWAPAQMGKKKMGCACDYRPNLGKGMGVKNGLEDIGLSLMAATTIFSVHASISPSYATFRSFFSRTPEEQAIARETLFLSLGASTLSSVGIYMVFKRWIPAIAAQIAGVGLFALGMYAIYAPPPSASTMEQKRVDQLTAGSNDAIPAVANPATPIPTATVPVG